jgi:hypothetical protein
MYKPEHIHLGYYENEYNIEAIAFLNENENYDVFFDDYQDEGLCDSTYDRHDIFGAFLFQVKDEDEGLRRFHEWIENVLIPLRNK